MKKNRKQIIAAAFIVIFIISYTFSLGIFAHYAKQYSIKKTREHYLIMINDKDDIIQHKDEYILQLETEKENWKTEKDNLTNDNTTLKQENETLKRKQVSSRGMAATRKTNNSVATNPNGWVTANVTAYCPCAKCCGKTNGRTASGTQATAGRTIAASSQYPFGTKIEIEGYGIYTVEDRGGAIKGNKIDMFFNSHNEALRFGRKQLRIRVVK